MEARDVDDFYESDDDKRDLDENVVIAFMTIDDVDMLLYGLDPMVTVYSRSPAKLVRLDTKREMKKLCVRIDINARG